MSDERSWTAYLEECDEDGARIMDYMFRRAAEQLGEELGLDKEEAYDAHVALWEKGLIDLYVVEEGDGMRWWFEMSGPVDASELH